MVTEIKTEHPHIVRVARAGGEEAVVKGTRFSVWFLVRQLRAGDSPEGIVSAYPALTLAAIHDAISYYHDHRSEIDPIIEHGDRQAEKFDALAGESKRDPIE
jgi:uncharacterized protein (DUF433 family)